MKNPAEWWKWVLCTFTLLMPCILWAEDVVTSDINRDGKPDSWTYINGGDVDRMELDINFDGKIDSVYIYDGKGKVKEEILDTNYDGRMDNWRFYKNGSLEEDEIDSDFNGTVDVWVYVNRKRIYRIEKDTTGDGKPDTIEQY